jgi:methanogenic corrinoid protein MtbC1
MDRLTQDGLMLVSANRDRWEGKPEVSPHGAWLDQIRAMEKHTGAEARMAWLLRTIEAEIIPRLMVAHQSASLAMPCDEAALATIGRDEVVAFATLVLTKPSEAAVARVECLRAEGVPLDAIYLSLLAPAARHLGELWEADLCDFTQVTLGLWRLQQLLYELSPTFQNEATFDAQRRRALLAPAPGSQHTLGLFIVAEFFRRAGWSVWSEPTTSLTDLTDALRADWFDVVGLSVGADGHVENLPSVILALRQASLNKSIGVMVGGPVFAAHPELAAAVGADSTAADAPQAVVMAEDLVAMREKRC